MFSSILNVAGFFQCFYVRVFYNASLPAMVSAYSGVPCLKKCFTFAIQKYLGRYLMPPYEDNRNENMMPLISCKGKPS